MKKPAAKISERQIGLRSRLWPMIKEQDLWLRAEKVGFSTVPRTLPNIMSIMDGLNKGNPVSSTYAELWCRVMDEMFVTLSSAQAMAFAAGFEGERGMRSWREKMRILERDGFIMTKEGPYGEMSYALILNPYHVIRRHYESGHPGLSEARYNALMERAAEIGAVDMYDDLPDNPQTRIMEI